MGKARRPELVPKRRPWRRRDTGDTARSHRWLGRTLLAERDRWALWAPVAFAAGILVYFALPSEPSPLLLAVLALGIVAAADGARRQRQAAFRYLGWLALALLLAGFATAQLRTLSVDAPVLPRASVYQLEGTIRTAEPRDAGQRLLLEDLVIERVDRSATPARVRLTIRAMDPPLLPGQRIKVRARLQPPSGAPVPGGFDFAERAFFEQLGGVGFAYGLAEVVGGPAAKGSRPIANLRFAIASRAETVIGGAEGAVAAALLTGLRASIPQEVWRNMQVAGLAHLLAISGLHMTLVAGTVFVACRFLLSLWPALALRVVPKKPAACVALFAAFAYLLLAGATVPTQRAFMMAGVALVAVLFDRNPLSLRLLAYAALAVLVMLPESLLGPSFQMSFAAVVGLIAFYETLRQRRRREAPEEDPFRLKSVVLLYFTGILLTTLIASVATTPFAAYHFQRIATYGALANLVAVPLTAFWIMPMGLLALILMPFGLDAPILTVMGKGIAIVLEVAAFATALPGAAIDITPWPGAGLLLIVLGGLWLCLWQTTWRRWGLGLVGVGILIALPGPSARSPGRPPRRFRRLADSGRRGTSARAQARHLAQATDAPGRRGNRGAAVRHPRRRAAALRPARLPDRPGGPPAVRDSTHRRGRARGLRAGQLRPPPGWPRTLPGRHPQPRWQGTLAERGHRNLARRRAHSPGQRRRSDRRAALDPLKCDPISNQQG
jgi:competence protein ComEC